MIRIDRISDPFVHQYKMAAVKILTSKIGGVCIAHSGRQVVSCVKVAVSLLYECMVWLDNYFRNSLFQKTIFCGIKVQVKPVAQLEYS